MHPQGSQPVDRNRSRTRRYDAYNPQRLQSRPNPSDQPMQSAASVPPHDIRNGYVPPQVSPAQIPADQDSFASQQAAAYDFGQAPQHSAPYAAQSRWASDTAQAMPFPPDPRLTQPNQPSQFNQNSQVPQANLYDDQNYQDQNYNVQALGFSAPADYQQLDSVQQLQQAPSAVVGSTAPPDFTAPRKNQRGVVSSILHATVQVDRVTRQSVKAVKHTFEPPQLAALRSRRQKLFMRSFYSLAAVSMFATVYLGAHQLLYGEDKKQQAQIQKVLAAETSAKNDATRSSELPSERQPTSQDMKTYLVAQQYPRYIRIPSMSIESRVRRLGLDSSGAVGTPNNIYDVGWYDSSAKPGDKDGVSIMLGHLAGPSAHGIFWGINKIATDTMVEIEKGNGEVVMYKVTKVEEVPISEFDMASYLKSEKPGTNELRLVTSTGKFDTVSVNNSDRYVVFATQIK